MMTIPIGTLDLGQIRTGAIVQGPKGDRIGRVHSLSSVAGPQSGAHLVVERKILFCRVGWLYIPVSAIALLTHGKVILKATHATAPDREWDQLPTAPIQ